MLLLLQWRLARPPGARLLLGSAAAARLTVPVDPDEAVVEDGLDAGDGPPGLLILSVLDERCLRVSTKNHLEGRRFRVSTGIGQLWPEGHMRPALHTYI